MENNEIFKGKTLSDIFEEIYNNSVNTRSRVDVLIGELKPLIENTGDATIIVPLIKDYMDIGVKNDDHLIKLANIVHRLEALKQKGETKDFDFSELQDLLQESEDSKNIDNPDKDAS